MEHKPEAFTMSVKPAVFRNVMPCSLVKTYQMQGKRVT